MSLDDPYYRSSRYGHFRRSVYELADEAGVDVLDDTDALGLYEGTNEPSSAIEVSGSRIGVEYTARELARRFNQTAVRVIYLPGSGEHRLYGWTLPPSVSEKRALAVLALAGVRGARVVEGRLEIADAEPLGSATLSVLAEHYGEAEVEPCEVVRIFSE